MKLDELPAELIVKVIGKMPTGDQARMRTLNHRLKGILDAQRMPRRRFTEMTLAVTLKSPSKQQLGRFRVGSNGDSRKQTRRMHILLKKKMHRDEICADEIPPSGSCPMPILEETLKMIQIEQRLNFERVHFNSGIMSILKNSKLSSAKIVSFELCRLHDITEDELASFLARTSCESLSLQYCVFSHCNLTDKVFASLPHVRDISISNRGPLEYHFQLTDVTLDRWAESPPDHVDLGSSTVTGFTVPAIIRLMESLKELISDGARSFSYQLGMIRCSWIEFLELSSPTSYFFSSRIICQSSKKRQVWLTWDGLVVQFAACPSKDPSILLYDDSLITHS